MTDEVANVLTQDGPEVEEIESTEPETTDAEPKAGEETEPGEVAKQGEEAEHKRLGGFKRKVLKAQQEAEFWREEALRNRSKGDEKSAEPDPDRPKRPKLADFQGTVEDYEKALEEYEGKLETWTNARRDREAVERQIETSVASLTKKVSDLPEWDEMKAAVQEHKMPMRLTNLLVAEAAKLKNGPETLKALLLDPDEAAQLAEFDKYEDGESIKAQIVSMSRALRIAGKETKSAEAEVDEEKPPTPAKPPAPINPVKKVAPTVTGLSDDLSVDEWRRRREAQLRKK